MNIFKQSLIHNSNIPTLKQKIQNSDLKKIINAGSWAPSPFNSQPWEFLLIEDKFLKEESYKIIKQSNDKKSIKKGKEIFQDTSAALIILYNTHRMDPGKNKDKLGLICLGACLNNICLASIAQGIKTTSLSTQTNKIQTELKNLLKIPEHIDIIMFFGFEYIDKSFSLNLCDIENIKELASETIYKNKYPEKYLFNDCNKNINIQDDIFTLISKRKSYRKKFLNKDILPEHEHLLVKTLLYAPCFSEDETKSWKLFFLQNKNLLSKLANLIRKSAEELYMDEHYYSKMKAWIRFSEKEINSQKDGIFTFIFIKYLGKIFEFGMKIMEKPFFKIFKKIMVKKFSKSFFHDMLKTSPMLIGLVYDTSKNKTKEEYQIDMINLGAVLQNILLAATSQNIGAQFLSILFDVDENKQKVIKELNLPQNLDIVDMIRIGYINPDAHPPHYFIVQSNIRRGNNEIFHVNNY